MTDEDYEFNRIERESLMRMEAVKAAAPKEKDMSKEAMKLALEALEETRNALAWFYDSYPFDVTKKGNELLPHVETVLTALRQALAEQPAQQEQGDSICQEDDGCPTEKVVLQRFWRGEPIPAEHYPAWFKPAPVQQEPFATVYSFDDLGGVYELVSPPKSRPPVGTKLYTSPPSQEEPVAWMQNTTAGLYVIDHYDEWHCIPLYTSPPQRPWVGLSDEEIINVMPDDDTSMSLGEAFSVFAELIEAKLKEKDMSKEEMKLALEALEVFAASYSDGNAAITALRQALANEALDRMAENARELGLDYTITQTGVGIGNPVSDHRLMEQPAPVQQDPVTYWDLSENEMPVRPRSYDPEEHPNHVPLYTTPLPCPTCEALARTVMLDQTSHDAQRKPLPCETLIELWCDASLANSGSGWFVVSGAFARAIEAAHGIGEKK